MSRNIEWLLKFYLIVITIFNSPDLSSQLKVEASTFIPPLSQYNDGVQRHA
ncbi:MAG: hypothetical protein KZQ90_04515 [Candidatus Thiodiazotropha sp. (ex Codakia rugifera)]|nr:hypothetical protein [Candidatus Thiodiazotropha sp. (ex Codakia rugifera)]